MSYKLTNSLDKVPRLDMTIKVRATLEDIAIYVTAEVGHDFIKHGDVVHLEAIKNTLTSKRKVMELAQKAIEDRGTTTPHYVVGDDVILGSVNHFVLEHIKKLWEE